MVAAAVRRLGDGMNIKEAHAAIIEAYPRAVPSRVKTAFRKQLKQGLTIDEAKVRVERYAAAGEFDREFSVPDPDYSDPTAWEGIQHADGKAHPDRHYYGWRAPKSRWK